MCKGRQIALDIVRGLVFMHSNKKVDLDLICCPTIQLDVTWLWSGAEGDKSLWTSCAGWSLCLLKNIICCPSLQLGLLWL